ncbi:hypothetical protein GBA52_018238 [Prunus armeniaca]|nr:hypothetical protein GBA52_018238 [Prunus armeniaca]
MGLLSEGLTQLLIPLAALVGLAFALLQWFLVSRVKVSGSYSDGNGYKDKLIGEAEEGVDSLEVTIKLNLTLICILFPGATSFLFTQYRYLSIFVGVFSAIIFLFLGSVKGFSTKSEPLHI